MGFKLPTRYFLLCTFLAFSFWVLLNVMSFMYVGTRNKLYENRGHGRHLQNDSPTDNFEREMEEDKDISTLGLIRNSEDQRVRENGYEKHAFNELISNRLGFHREVQDTRDKL